MPYKYKTAEYENLPHEAKKIFAFLRKPCPACVSGYKTHFNIS
jgi:hypothetical protein